MIIIITIIIMIIVIMVVATALNSVVRVGEEDGGEVRMINRNCFNTKMIKRTKEGWEEEEKKNEEKKEIENEKR